MAYPTTAAERRERKIALARQAGELDRELRKLPAGVLASLVQRRTGRWPAPCCGGSNINAVSSQVSTARLSKVADPKTYASIWPATVLIERIKELEAKSRKLES